MRNLIGFILKYSSWFVFTILFVISLALLFSGSTYHSSVWFTSANSVSSKVYGLGNGVFGYFNLRSINKSLQTSNARLGNEVLNLRAEVAALRSQLNDTATTSPTKRYDYVLATVINNSVRHPHNYFTIDKGTDAGVMSGMGVVDQNGVVGVVNVAGKKTARVMSLLNSTQRLSVKLKGTETVGSLSWKANDPSIGYMDEVPRHTVYNIGDTVVTSGYSTTFPSDIPVGVVAARIRTSDDNFFVLKVKLISDFKTLSNVRVLKDFYKSELDSLKKFDVTE